MEAREVPIEVICIICGQPATRQVPSLCSHTVVTETTTPSYNFEAHHSHQLVSLESMQVKVFNFTQQEWDIHPLPRLIDMDMNSRYLWVDSGLFCSGGMHSLGFGAGRQKAYLLGIGDWAVTQLADMLNPRLFHGLWWLPARHLVLAFGGKVHIGLRKSYLRPGYRLGRM